MEAVLVAQPPTGENSLAGLGLDVLLRLLGGRRADRHRQVRHDRRPERNACDGVVDLPAVATDCGVGESDIPSREGEWQPLRKGLGHQATLRAVIQEGASIVIEAEATATAT